MKFALIAVFAFLAVASATETTFMSTLKADIAVLMQKGATIESVLKLLDDILVHEQNDLKNLIHKWIHVDQPAWLEKAAKAKVDVDNKKEECATIKKFIESQEHEITVYEENISRSQAKIAANNKSVAKREDTRCKNNLVFLDKVREARQVKSFLTYLVKEMTKKSFANTIASNAGAFLTLREIALHQHDDSIAELTKLHLMASFIEADPNTGYTDAQLDKMFDKKARTDKEIGTGHIDNKKKDLSLDTYKYTEESAADYVQGVIKFVRAMIGEIEDNINKLRTAEEDAVAAFQSFRTKIEYENLSLTIFIKQAKLFIVEIKKDIEENKAIHAKCVAEIPPLEAILAHIQKQYKDASDAYFTKKHNLENVVIPTLEKAKKAYLAKVNSASAEYHTRVKDYAADNKFDKTNFEDRTKFNYKK